MVMIDFKLAGIKLESSEAYRWFSRYVIAGMLVDGKQKIAH